MKRRITITTGLAALLAGGVLAALALAPTAAAYTWDQLPSLGYGVSIANLANGCHDVSASYGGTFPRTYVGNDCDSDFQAKLDAFIAATCPCAQPATTAAQPTTTVPATPTVTQPTTTEPAPAPQPPPPTVIVTTTVQAPLPAPPVADFSAASANPNVVTFTDTTVAASPLASRIWIFGDGTVGVGATVTHGYAAPGSYYVALIVADGNGLTSTAAHAIDVNGTSLALGPRQTQLSATPSVKATTTTAVKPKPAKKPAKKKAPAKRTKKPSGKR